MRPMFTDKIVKNEARRYAEEEQAEAIQRALDELDENGMTPEEAAMELDYSSDMVQDLALVALLVLLTIGAVVLLVFIGLR